MTVPHRHSPYARFERDQLILRDVLAVERTYVANERTLLGYVRTSLAIAGGGAALLHFGSAGPAALGGWAMLGAALPIAVIGVRLYLRRRRHLVPLLRHAEGDEPAAGGRAGG